MLRLFSSFKVKFYYPCLHAFGIHKTQAFPEFQIEITAQVLCSSEHPVLTAYIEFGHGGIVGSRLPALKVLCRALALSDSLVCSVSSTYYALLEH